MIAIDLGSNTLRCIVYDCVTKEFANQFEAIVKTADGLHVSKKINENAVQRVIDALLKADKKLDFFSHKVCAYTTEAMRQAGNAQDVLEQIYQKTGVLFEIISGDKEAAYTTLAVKNRLDHLGHFADSFTLVDIGGGSTEVIFYDNGKIISKSFHIGIVTLTQSCTKIEQIKERLDELLLPVEEYINTHYINYTKPPVYVQTAGTPTTIAAYLQGMNYQTYESAKINGYTLDVEKIQSVLEELLAMDEKTRSFYVGVGREDLIISGILIVQKMYEILGYTQSVVIDDGLREGIALDFCENIGK